MPCGDNQHVKCEEDLPLSVQLRLAKERLVLTTRLACEYCQLIESAHTKTEVEIPAFVPDYANAWWNQHKMIDAERTKGDDV